MLEDLLEIWVALSESIEYGFSNHFIQQIAVVFIRETEYCEHPCLAPLIG